MKGFNHIGTWTLYKKEVHRFAKVYNQTLLAPVVTALLFLAIFNLAIGDNVKRVGDVPFAQFMAAGLIMMAVVQNAFANTSSSFTMGKVLGTIIDYLMPPISAGELAIAMVAAAITRGLCVGVLTAIALAFFIDIHVHSWLHTLFYLCCASTLLALLGLFAGIIAETFDQMAAVTSYVITPMAFLSGTFYSIANLPEFWQKVSSYNPFFYMIDGFRYGLTGYHDGNLTTGAIVLVATTLALWATVYTMLLKGYRVKQ